MASVETVWATAQDVFRAWHNDEIDVSENGNVAGARRPHCRVRGLHGSAGRCAKSRSHPAESGQARRSGMASHSEELHAMPRDRRLRFFCTGSEGMAVAARDKAQVAAG